MLSFSVVVAFGLAFSTAAFADAGDRVDQVFPATPVVTEPATPADVPAAASDSNTSLPPSFVNVYFGGA